MKCDTCEFKKLHIGFGPPDDYSAEYCSNGHWVGGPLDEVIEDDYWANCADYRFQDCNGGGAVEIGEGECSVYPHPT